MYRTRVAVLGAGIIGAACARELARAGGAPDAPALRRSRRSRDRGRGFAERLAKAHPIGPGWPGWLRPETIVCRCEETDYATVCQAANDPAAADPRVARLNTRAGLGPCQARICGPTVADLTERLRPAPPGGPAPATPHRRPIAQPIRLGELARDPEQLAPDPAKADPSKEGT